MPYLVISFILPKYPHTFYPSFLFFPFPFPFPFFLTLSPTYMPVSSAEARVLSHTGCTAHRTARRPRHLHKARHHRRLRSLSPEERARERDLCDDAWRHQRIHKSGRPLGWTSEKASKTEEKLGNWGNGGGCWVELHQYLSVVFATQLKHLYLTSQKPFNLLCSLHWLFFNFFFSWFF